MDEITKLKEWLHLTNQQCSILRCIAVLEQEASRPKDLERKYRELSGKSIQKTNLFGVLKHLSDHALLVKDAKENYRLNIPSIKGQLEAERQKIKLEEDRISDFLSNPAGFITIDDSAKDSILVNLLNGKQVYQKLNSKLELYKEYYNNSRFPSLFFTETIAKRIDRDGYIETMETGLANKTLSITYLTNLDISRAYNHALRIFKQKENALKETELVIRRLRELIEKHDNLRIYYSEAKPDWEFITLSNGYPKELFLILRSKDNDVPGTLHILSSDVAQKAFRIIQKRIESSQRIDRSNIEKFEKRLLRSIADL